MKDSWEETLKKHLLLLGAVPWDYNAMLYLGICSQSLQTGAVLLIPKQGLVNERKREKKKKKEKTRNWEDMGKQEVENCTT